VPDIAGPTRRALARWVASGRRIGEAWGRALDLRPCGAPERPLLEAALLFCAFYLVSFVPGDPSAVGRGLSEARYYGLLLVELLPKTCLLGYLMARAEGLAAFGIRRPRPADLVAGLLSALGACAAAALPTLLFSALGWTNPLLESAGSGGPIGLAPLVLLASLAIGYGEELFFRAYLIRRLGQAGLPPPWAALASTLAFGSAHGLQGLPGLVVAALLGLWFTWRWLKGRNLHEIALGHALYDAAVMAIAIWGGF